MKTTLRSFLIYTASLWIVSQLGSGIEFAKGTTTLFMAGVGLSLTHFILRPIVNLLILPINLVTLGLFRWVSNVITLWVVTKIVPDFRVVAFNFHGFSSSVISLPSFNTSGVLALIVVSFTVSALASFIFWLRK